MAEEGVDKVKVGDKEIVIDEGVLGILRRYVHTEMSLEHLASELGLGSWEEAYEFLNSIPAWMLWIQPSLWKTLREMKGAKEELQAKG